MADIIPSPNVPIAIPVSITESPALDIAAPASINTAAGDGSIAVPVVVTPQAVVAIGNPSQ